MRLITYRKTDGVIFWIGDTNAPDYLDPIMRDDLQQVLQVQPSPVQKWYESWYVWQDGTVAEAKNLRDEADIRLWRSKVVTLNMLAAAVNVVRQRVLPPLHMQSDVYRWKHMQAIQGNPVTELLETYQSAQRLTHEELRALIVMKDQQFFAAIAKTETYRELTRVQIVAATTVSELEGIRMGINRWIG